MTELTRLSDEEIAELWRLRTLRTGSSSVIYDGKGKTLGYEQTEWGAELATEYDRRFKNRQVKAVT